MKENLLASLPTQATEVSEVKWSRKLPRNDIFFLISQTSWKMNSDNVNMFGEVWNRQKVMDDESGIVQKKPLWAKHIFKWLLRATSCTIFVWKIDFCIAHKSRREKS